MNLEELCYKVCEITESVGLFIKEQGGKINEESVEEKSLNSLVTYVDKTAEMQLVKALGKLIPESGFITEEKTISKKGDVYNWIIDPLDGTTNFIHGIPCYCISIALMRNDTLILGVINELNQREKFYAWEGSKAYLNGKEIKISSTTELKNSLLATGFPYYDYNKMDQYIELLKVFMRETRGVRRLGSAATDLAYVACGRFDGFYEYGLNSWDVAAGAFIIQQAGGIIKDFKGGKNYVFGEDIMACSPGIYEEFIKKIKHHFN
ncbi:MAG: inositol monophosphatase [Bacteroidetes bacterium]|nr:inositol monophosphatase [Bacteroidota bacterium]HET6243401.1 inositol monophosphatase family protein [Bacteroidia bacterium]